MEFNEAYEAFMKSHFERRRGPDAERIKGGLQHAEQEFLEHVWWPAFRNFDHLHPEYKIHDFKDGHRYIDFAYVQTHFKVAIEIDGMGAHWKEITAEQFSDDRQRQNHLVIDRWHLLRFAYRDVHEHPRYCQQTIQQMLGRLTGDSTGVLEGMKIVDREMLKLALWLNRPITAHDVMTHCNLGADAALRHLRRLAELGWLIPARGTTRIGSYRIHPSRTNIRM